jgi:hypothetical protein
MRAMRSAAASSGPSSTIANHDRGRVLDRRRGVVRISERCPDLLDVICYRLHALCRSRESQTRGGELLGDVTSAQPDLEAAIGC